MFENRNRARDDCCAISCCGVLLSDRNGYLLDNNNLPDWGLRRKLNIWLPVILLFLITVLSVSPTDPGDPVNKIPPTPNPMLGVTTLAFYCVVILLLVRAVSYRSKRRQIILAKLYEQQHGTPDMPQELAYSNMRDVGHAAGCCCCYHNDAIYTLVDGEDDADTHQMEASEPPLPPDLCTCLWKFFSLLCCGALCHSWLQCCGMCGIAQENYQVQQMLLSTNTPREVKKMLQLDFITFQPFAEFYPSILALRATGETALVPHWKALSKLSKGLIKYFAAYLILEAIIKLVKGQMMHYIVLLLTYGQALLLLYLVHWKWHKLTVSLDAVIKYFFSGYVFSVLMAQVFEMLLTVVFAIVALVVVTKEAQEDAGTTALDVWFADQQHIHDFLKEHLGQFAIFIFIFAFIIAAFVEELTKYFGFWMTETPDLMDHDEIILDDESDDTARPRQNPSLVEKGCSISIAMVAAASGFACAENVGYVFTSPRLQDQIVILLMRSMLPVHQVCAAIQSIGVVRRDLEGDETMQLGRIVLPAIVLHGLYDFVAMFHGIAEIAESDDTATQPPSTESPPMEPKDILQIMALVLPVCISGVAYYFVQAKFQRRRLGELDAVSASGRLLLAEEREELGHDPTELT